MAQVIEVIGVGNVEFPDGMSKEAIGQALKKLPMPKPENLYTQNAQDIQYSPEGIPLNTAPYGAVNPYQKTEKALTTTVSVPLNVATGAAKIPAALVQAYDKITALDLFNRFVPGGYFDFCAGDKAVTVEC